MTMNNNEQVQGYDFNATIEIPDNEFVLLPEGQYKFTVTNKDMGFHQPNPQNPGKMPAGTGFVKLHLTLDGGQLGTATVQDRFFMHPSVNWRIGAFFKSIGMIPEDSKQITLNWDAVIGKTGYCTIKHTQGTKEGTTFMNVDRYLKPSQVQNQNATPQANTGFSL